MDMLDLAVHRTFVLMDMLDLAVHRTFGRIELRMYSAGIIIMGNPPPKKKYEGGHKISFNSGIFH